MTTPATPTDTGNNLPATAAPTRVSIPVRAGLTGLVPTTFDEMWSLARVVAGSELVPKDFRGKPHNVLIAIQHGLECGVPWMQAIQNTAIINGRPALYGDVFLAVIMDSDKYIKHDEWFEAQGKRVDRLTSEDLKREDTCAVCSFWRRGQEQPTTRRFSIGQAKRARLLDKPGPWSEYTDRQLQMRARAFAGRDTFPDVLKGLSHPAEELKDLPPEDVTVVPAREVRRLSETRHDFIDREPDIRQDGPSVPPADPQVMCGPLKVKDVQPFLSGLFIVKLQDGTQMETEQAADAMELEKFKGTDHQLNFTCTRRADGNLHLETFNIAD